MTVTEIIDSLCPGSPQLREAIDEAVRQKEAVIPALLKCLQNVLEDITDAIEGDCTFIAAAYLLAQFGEKSAFPLLVSLLRLDEDTERELWGDIVTQSYSLMLRDTFNGDIGLLREVIENYSYSPWARKAALDAYGFLFHDGRITRRELTRYLRRLIRVVYDDDLDEDDVIVVTGVAHVVADYHLIEMIEDIKELYEADFIDTGMLEEEDFLEMVNDLNKPLYWDRHITDTVEELETWKWFD
jgi:hypothetical protein